MKIFQATVEHVENGKRVKETYPADRVVLRSPEGYEITVTWNERASSFRIETESLTPPNLSLVPKED